jgi:hypothetical protein
VNDAGCYGGAAFLISLLAISMSQIDDHSHAHPDRIEHDRDHLEVHVRLRGLAHLLCRLDQELLGRHELDLDLVAGRFPGLVCLDLRQVDLDDLVRVGNAVFEAGVVGFAGRKLGWRKLAPSARTASAHLAFR